MKLREKRYYITNQILPFSPQQKDNTTIWSNGSHKLMLTDHNRNVNTETKESSSKFEKDAQKAENPHCGFINYGMESFWKFPSIWSKVQWVKGNKTDKQSRAE